MNGKETTSEIELIPVEKLTISPFNVRKRVSDTTELQRSIASMGLLQPIIVRPVEDRFEVVVGQRRFLACKGLGWETIPAVKQEMADTEALILFVTDSVQIDSIGPIDGAEGTKRLITDLEAEMSRMQPVEWVAKQLGKSSSTVYE